MSQCKCFDTFLTKVTEHLAEQLRNNEAETLKANWESASFVVEGNSLQSKVGIVIAYEYRKFKKSGEQHKNPTKGSVKMFMDYCPFCGCNLESADE